MSGSDLIRDSRTPPAPGDAFVSTDAPWPGLASFTEEQSGFFHGRDEEIRTLARLMERKALTVLFGQSGLGKSSLLQAGVFPRLRTAGFCPIYIRLDHAEGAPSPTEQVKNIVAAETARVGTWTKPGVARPGETLWEFFHHRDDRLVDAGGRTIVPVLVFDQFEELFTLGAARAAGSGPGDAQRDRAVAFMSELAELVENRPSEQLVARLDRSTDEMDAFDFSRTDYRVCISLREDYLPHLEGLKTNMPALMENRMRLTRMTGTQALDAVLKPGGALVTDEVARAIVEFVSGARGGSAERLAELDVEPPLLSVICRELNERRRARDQAQITADLVTGNRREILHDFYERSVADLPEPMRRFVEDKLLTKSGFRDNLALETALEEPGVTKPLIDTLVARRLLRIEDRIGTQRVELTHDVLADVVRASRDARQQRLALEQAQARERAALAANARRTRRTRAIIGGLTVAVCALLVGAFFGVRAQHRAEAAEREAAAQSSRTDFIFGSQLLEQDKVPEGLAYLVRAARSDPTNSVVGPRLISALAYRSFAEPVGQPLLRPAVLIDVGYAADGHHCVSTTRDHLLCYWDLDRAKLIQTINVGELAARPVLTPDGSRVVTGGIDGTVNVWELATGRRTFGPLRHEQRITGLALSSDGRSLVSGGLERSVKMWDARTGDLKFTLRLEAPLYGAVFSPDCRYVFTCTGAGGHWRIWSAEDGAPLSPDVFVSVGVPHANNGGFSPDGKLIAVPDNSGVQIYDAATGAKVGPRLAHAGPSYFAAFTRDGKKLVTTADDGTARVWTVPSGTPVFPPLRHGGPVHGTRLTPDDHYLLTVSDDGVAHVWDLRSGRQGFEPIRVGHVNAIDLSRDGSEFLSAGADGNVRRWRTTAGAIEPLRSPIPGNNPVDAQGVMWRMEQGVLRRINLLTGKEVVAPLPLPFGPSRVMLGADGRHLAVATAAGYEFWEIRGTEVVRHPFGSEMPATTQTRNHAFSRDCTHFALWDETANAVRVWNTENGRPSLVVENSSTANNGYPFSLDGRLIATVTADNSVALWDVSTSRRAGASLHQRSAIYCVVFAPSGDRVASGGFDGAVQIWDVKTSQPTVPAISLGNRVRGMAFTRDSRRLLTYSNLEARMWDVATAQPLTDPMPAGNDLFSGRFSEDDTRVVTRTRDGIVRIWDSASGQMISEPLRTPAGSLAQSFFGFLGGGQFVGLQRGGFEIWPIPPQSHQPAPEWLLRLARVAAGGEIGSRGNFHEEVFDANVLGDIRRELDALPKDAPYAEWGRWFLADRATRPIAPGFTVTTTQAKKLYDEYQSALPSAAPRPPPDQ